MTTDPDQFAIIPVYTDSTGRKAVPGDAVFVGSRSAVMERILDSKTRRECFTLLNDAKRIREEKRAVDAARKEVTARVDAVTQAENLIRQLCDKVGTLTARMDSFEEQKRVQADAEERAEQEKLASTAFYEADQGELQAVKEPPASHTPGEGDEDDLDVGVLPRALIGPSSTRDPDLPPHPTLVMEE
jgi:hypothetical protein